MARASTTGRGGRRGVDSASSLALRSRTRPGAPSPSSRSSAYTAVALLPPYLAKVAIDDGINAGNLRTLSLVVVAFLVAGIAAFVLSSAQTYYTGWVGERALADLRIQLFRHLQRLSLGYYERNRTGATVSRITNDVEALDQLVTDGVSSLVQNSLVLVGTVVVLFLLDWRLALATLVVLPLMGLATAWFRSRSNHAYRRVRERLGLVTATLAEDLSGMRVVQSFTREPTSQSTFRGVNERYRESNYETVVLNGVYFPAVDILSSVATAIVLGVGGWLVVDGEMADRNAASRSCSTSRTSSTRCSSSRSSTTRSSPRPRRSTASPPSSTRSRTSSTRRTRASSRRFKGTSASSTSASDTASSPTSCTTSTSTSRPAPRSRSSATRARGSRRSRSCSRASTTRARGASRSTAPTCARSRRPRFADSSESFRRRASSSRGSIADNIAFGRPDASRAEIERAAEAVGADGFIAELPEGYDTEVGERGFKLSLGQRQLVAFARALLADPRILILDEATSSVDIGTERRIDRGLRRLVTGRTAFIIAHRLSTIRRADLIVVLDHGRIVDAGTHDELIDRPGPYTRLYGDWAAEVA